MAELFGTHGRGWSWESIEVLEDPHELHGEAPRCHHTPGFNSASVNLIETTIKGPRGRLPDGFEILDKQGVGRKDVRPQWWTNTASTWRDIAISVPEPSDLPDSPLPAAIKTSVYPAAAKPVFFGHYWMTGEPVLQTHNALCFDYSAGSDGPLATCVSSGSQFNLSCIDLH